MPEIALTIPAESQLRDESGIRGNASIAAAPVSPEELQSAVRLANILGGAVTAQGARTGICGGAAAPDGLIIDMSALNRATGFFFDPGGDSQPAITIGAGATLRQLNDMLADKSPAPSRLDAESPDSWRLYRESDVQLELAPNPTELSATLGGMAATNASGSHGWWGGDMRANVLGIEVVLPDGSLARENRPHAGGAWRAESAMPACPGCRDGGGLVDLFCGSEGIVGAIAGLTLRLVRAPKFVWGMSTFFSSADDMLRFAGLMRGRNAPDATARMRSADFFDRGCLAFLASMRERMEGAKVLPEFPDSARFLCWLEFGGDDENALSEFLEKAADHLEKTNSPSDLALVATDAKDFKRLSMIRHTITEAANLASPVREGLLIDIGVPPDILSPSIDRLHALIERAGCAGTLMGHLMDGQLTIRLLPESPEQEKQAVKATGGCFGAMRKMQCHCGTPHGIGRVKKRLFSSLCPSALARAKRARDAMNPPNKWGRGIFFD